MKPFWLRPLSFKLPYRSFVGVDLGTQGMKCVHIRRKAGEARCVWRRGGLGASEAATEEAFPFRHFEGAFALPDERVERYEIKIPKLPEKEIDSAIKWQLGQLVPDIASIYYDYSLNRTGTGYSVTCTSTPRTLVDKLFEEGKCFFQPKTLETESSALIAVVNEVTRGSPPPLYMVVDLGHSAFRLFIVKDAVMIFSRALYFGLANVCHQIANQFDMKSQDVDHLLGEMGTQPAEESLVIMSLKRVLHEQLYTLGEELSRSESFVRERSELEPISNVYLCGGGACLPTAVDYLTLHLSDRTVTPIDPFQDFRPPKGLERTGPMWACAVGLALRV